MKDLSKVDLSLLKLRYCEGEEYLLPELINRFQPLMDSFKLAIWLGTVPESQEVKQFLRYFKSDAKSAAESLTYSLRKYYTEEDITQVLVVSLIQAIQSYRVISKSLKYTLKENIVKMTKDVGCWRTTYVHNIRNVNDKSDELVDVDTIWFSHANQENLQETMEVLFVEQFGSRLGKFAFNFFYLKRSLQESANICGLTYRQAKRYSQKVKDIYNAS